MKDVVQDYLRQLERQLPCPRTVRGPFLKRLEDELEHFCSRHPEADADTLAECFGPPEDVAREFLAETNPEAMAIHLRKRSRGLIAAASMVLLALGAVGLLIHQRPTADLPSTESQVIASIIYTQANSEEEEPSADVFVSTGAPPTPINDETKPWYHCIVYGGASNDFPQQKAAP